MGYFIPFKHADRDIFKDEGNPSRFLRVIVDPAGSAHTFTPVQISCSADADYQKWNMKIKNRASISVGWLAGEPCVVQVSTDESYWYTVFTGYVSDAGFNRTRGLVTDDYVSLDMVDATQRKGTKRVLSPALLANYQISNPDNLSSSLIHYLADKMGVDLEVFPIEYVKDIVSVGDSTVWEELQKLKAAFGADMYFNHLGQLRFVSQFDSAKNLTLFDSSDVEQFVTVIDSDGNPQTLTLPSQTEDPEWLFQGDPDQPVPDNGSWIKGKVTEVYLPVRCNRAKTEFIDYEELDHRIIYKNKENYNEALDEISIELPAGAYWPGDAAEDVAQLEYMNPENGEEYPYAIEVDTPTIGVTGDVDILYTGGSLEIVSFNGSTGATKQNPGSSEIILHNTGATTCTIKRLRITGTPFRAKEKEIVEYADTSITDEVDYVDKSIDGKYVIDKDQVYTTLFDMVENQKNRVRRFAFSTAYLPWIQRGAIVQVQMPGEDPVRCRVDSYDHQNRSRTLQGMVTSVICTGKEVYSPTGSIPVIKVPAKPAIPGPQGPAGEDGKAAPRYLGTATSDPSSPEDKDFYLYTGTTGSGRTKGNVYIYDQVSGSWSLSTASDLVGAALKDALALAKAEGNMVDAAWAIIENLVAESLKVLDGDFETRINDTDGMIILYNGNQLFKVNPTNGIIYFGQHFWYDPSDGKIHTPNDKTVINTDGTIEAVGGSFSGKITVNNVPFQPLAAGTFSYNTSLVVLSTKNISSVTRTAEGNYHVELANPPKVKANLAADGYSYIDIFVVANTASTFSTGFNHAMHCNPNWLRNYVDGRLPLSGGYATLEYVDLYFIDNDNDQLLDPHATQFYLFSTETLYE